MKIFPVIHLQQGERGIDTAVEEGDRAFSLGADGVYLIDHINGSSNVHHLFQVFNSLKAETNLGWDIGVNILGMGPQEAMATIAMALADDELFIVPDAAWIDDMRQDIEPKSAMELKRQTIALENVRIMGGVAFKYTATATEDPVQAASEAMQLMDAVDVVTTSGAGTGRAPTVSKLSSMKQVIGKKRLAVASGISIDNIYKYEGVVDDVLVSTSIETAYQSGKFDHSKLRDIIQVAHDLA